MLINGQGVACRIVLNFDIITLEHTELSHGCEKCDAEIKHMCDLNVHKKININLSDILAISSRIGLYTYTHNKGLPSP